MTKFAITVTGFNPSGFNTRDMAIHVPSPSTVTSDAFYVYVDGIVIGPYGQVATSAKYEFSIGGSLTADPSNEHMRSYAYSGSSFTYGQISAPSGDSISYLTGGNITGLAGRYHDASESFDSQGHFNGYNYNRDWSVTGISIAVSAWMAATDAQRHELLFQSDDTIVGSQYQDILDGKAGNDAIWGGLGADVMYGGARNDLFYVDAGDEVREDAGGGYDMVFASSSFALRGASEVEVLRTMDPNGVSAVNLSGSSVGNTIIGNNGVNRISGAAGNDVISALGGNDIIDGGTGADRMSGGSGDDIYYVDNAADVVIELAGEGALDQIISTVSYRIANGIGVNIMTLANGVANDATLLGNDFDQRMNGNDNANALSGLGGNDTIYGLGGDDRLLGGLGNDVLHGGLGRDSFYFNTALDPAGNVDRIGDFNVADDTIRLDHAIFASLGVGALNPSAFRIGVGAADGDDRIIYNAVTGALIYDANGNEAGGAYQFATLDPGLALTRADFLIY